MYFMIGLIYIALYVLLISLSKIKFKSIINIISVFTSIWFLFGFLSMFGINHLRKPNYIVHILAMIFVLFVDLTFLITMKKSKNIAREMTVVIRESPNKNIKILQVITWILLGRMFLESVIVFISTGSLTAVRDNYFLGMEFGSVYSGLLFRTIPMAAVEALIIIHIYNAFKLRKIKYLVLSLINMLIVTIINGGRYMIIYVIYAILLVYISLREYYGKHNMKNLIPKRIKKYMIYSFIVGVIFMIYTTIRRGQNIISSTISYFSGSFSFLDYILENPSNFGFTSRMNGYFTFSVIIEPLVMMLKGLGLTTAKIPSYYFNIYCQNFYDIGSDGYTRLFNNNTTVLYYFLRDSGIIGIIFGGILLGLVTAVLYNKWKKGSEFCGLLYIYMAIVLLDSVMTFHLCSYAPIFTFIAFYICSRKNRKSSNGSIKQIY